MNSQKRRSRKDLLLKRQPSRTQYIDEFKNSLRQQIESIKIIDDDGKALTAKQYNEQQKKKK